MVLAFWPPALPAQGWIRYQINSAVTSPVQVEVPRQRPGIWYFGCGTWFTVEPQYRTLATDTMNSDLDNTCMLVVVCVLILIMIVLHKVLKCGDCDLCVVAVVCGDWSALTPLSTHHSPLVCVEVCCVPKCRGARGRERSMSNPPGTLTWRI